MSTSKHIDILCVIAAVCALLLTILFMNGQSLGITVLADEDAGSGQFTDNDLRHDWADEAEHATQITLTGNGAEIHGNGAYFYDGGVHIVYAGEYIVSGQLNDGSLIIDADKDDKVWILLNGAEIRSETGAALIVEQAEKVFLTLADGTENEIAGWTKTDGDSSDESGGVDGAIYSRDDLTINGSGSLAVTTNYQHAVVCNDDLVITGGKISVTAPQDGLHANDSVRIAEADLTIQAGDDGITAGNDDDTSYFYMESGSVTIPSCYEGIEAIDIIIAGGAIDITPVDDGINANGGSSSSITITDGRIRIVNPTGRDADGLDSNGSIDISGGNLFISVNGSGSNCAIDCGSENGGACKISGGTVIAAGGSGMAEGFDSSSEQCFIMQTVTTTEADTPVTLKNEAGDTLLSETVPCSFSSIILSTPDLQMGETCTVQVGDTETEVVVDNSSASGFGMFGRGGKGMFGGTGRGGRMSMPQGTDGEISQMPDGEFPQRTDGELPQMPDGEFPQMPNGEFPQMPDGEFPQRTDGDSPQMPDDELPQGTDGDSSQTPDGELPQRPNGGLHQWTDGEMPQRTDGGLRQRTTGEMRQWAGENGPAASSAAVSVSSETWLIIGLSALCLAAGLLAAWKVKH